jgi:hypothetical protein
VGFPVPLARQAHRNRLRLGARRGAPAHRGDVPPLGGNATVASIGSLKFRDWRKSYPNPQRCHSFRPSAHARQLAINRPLRTIDSTSRRCEPNDFLADKIDMGTERGATYALGNRVDHHYRYRCRWHVRGADWCFAEPAAGADNDRRNHDRISDSSSQRPIEVRSPIVVNPPREQRSRYSRRRRSSSLANLAPHPLRRRGRRLLL